jgi:division protein CdvB (Snf7/Vps24/ESCRT-III family)
MAWGERAFDEIKELLQIGERVAGLAAQVDGMERRLDQNLREVRTRLDEFIDRLARVEEKYDNLRATLRGEILGEIAGKMAKVETVLTLMPHLLRDSSSLRPSEDLSRLAPPPQVPSDDQPA